MRPHTHTHTSLFFSKATLVQISQTESLFYSWLSSFTSTTCWTTSFFIHCIFFPLCHRLIDQGVWVYFWAFYFVPLIYVSILLPIICCFDYCSLAVYTEVWEGYTFNKTCYNPNIIITALPKKKNVYIQDRAISFEWFVHAFLKRLCIEKGLPS